MSQTRRQFLKGILGAAALVAAAKVGLGNVTAEMVAEQIAPVAESSWAMPPRGMQWIIDPNCPPDRIYLIGKEFFNKDNPDRHKYAASLTI